jgi:metal-responsive CopG/Arc/MetJ family transcriptional regulator
MSGDSKPAGRSRRRTYVKLAVTLPEQLAQAVRAEAEAVGSPSLSAFIARAVEEKLERDRLQEALDEIFREQPMTDEEREWADHVLLGR